MKFSILIVTFKSEHLLGKLLKKIPKKHQIIIVENSGCTRTKKNIEKNFKNTKVLTPPKNLGYASAFNLGLKKCKHKLVLTLTPDINMSKILINQLEKIVKTFKNFTILAPEYKNQKIHKNYFPINNSEKIKLKGFILEQVKELDWCFCIINTLKTKRTNLLDEKFFLYFETTDYSKRLIKNNHKFYVVKNLFFNHLGTGSTKKKYNFEIQVNRNWHYNWSKFYYFKKNFNYLYAIKKLLPNLYQGLVGIIISILKINYSHIQLHMASIKGALSGIFLLKSYFRPNIQ